MATLSKTYGVTLVANEGIIYYGPSVNIFFGSSNNRIAMLKFEAPEELDTSHYVSSAILRMQLKGDTQAGSGNITIGLIDGAWGGNISGGESVLTGYCNGPTITRSVSFTTTSAEKTVDVTELLQMWAQDPTAYSGLFLRSGSIPYARISSTNCDITYETAARTAPGAPTTAYLSASVAETDPTLHWSGASHGVNNNIFGYEIQYADSADGSTWGAWTYLKSVNNPSLSGSTTVALPATRGYYRKYRIKSLGEWEIDSGWKEAGHVRKNSAPSAPANVTASPNPYESGGITVTFTGATDADNNIVSHEVQRASSADNVTFGGWTNVNAGAAGSSLTDSPTITRGQYVKYRARAKDAFGVTGNWKESNVVRRNSAPAAPTINYPGNGKTTYNSRPRLLVTVGNDADNQNQTISASGYTASTPGAQQAGKKLVLRRTNSASAGIVSASVISTDSLGASSDAANKSLTYTNPVFTDNLYAGTTTIKAVHINELRTMVNTIRDYYGLPAYSWSETIEAGTTPLSNWASHIAELRAAIDDVVSFVNSWDSTATANKITLPTRIPLTGNKPRADVITQLRAEIALL
jgi:hypothetical protein